MSNQEQMNALIGRVADVAKDKVAEIKKVTGTTRILALNALIEATRAGELGKGFAVVAGEVKQVSQVINDITQSLETELNAAIDELREMAARMESDHTDIAP